MISSKTEIKAYHSNSTKLKGETIMAKYICNTKEKDSWKLLPGEASKQTFTNEEDALEWYEKEFPGQKIELSEYHFNGDHSTGILKADGKSVGRIDLYD